LRTRKIKIEVKKAITIFLMVEKFNRKIGLEIKSGMK